MVESFRCAGILLWLWQGENFAYRQYLKVCHFQPVHCARQNPTYPKVFNRFWKSLPHLETFMGGHLGVKFQVRRYFTFVLARWKLCVSTIFESLPLSTCTLCQEKSYISIGIQLIFEIFAWVSKLLRVGISVGSFRCAGILLLQRQGENFPYRQNLKVCHFQPVHCESKNPISTKVFNRFSKSLHQLEDVEGVHLVGKIQVRRYIIFAMTRWKLCPSTTFESFPLSTCTLCHQKPCIS